MTARSKTPARATVAIVQRIVPHYRVDFFQRLQAALEKENVRLSLIYGQHRPDTVPRTVDMVGDWVVKVTNSYLDIFDRELVWQPCYSRVRRADLVIVEQASRLLLNYLLFATRLVGGKQKLAYWGHGKNLQASSRIKASECVKKQLSREVDWWFAYTPATADILIDASVPPSRITVVYNTIDASTFQAQVAEARGDSYGNLLGRSTRGNENLVVYCGAMYAEKKLGFLIEAAHRVRGLISDFEIIFMGDGPCAGLVVDAARKHGWIKYVGAQLGAAKAEHFARAKALVIPGAVGLAITDSFAAGIPLVTTEDANHGPEIAYLKSGVNGIMVPEDTQAYADAIVSVLSSLSTQQAFRDACHASARSLSLDNMVTTFTTGIMDCLASTSRSSRKENPA